MIAQAFGKSFCMAVFTLLGVATLAAPARQMPVAGPSEPEQPRILERAGFDQNLNAQLPLDLEFRDETGATVRLGDYFGDKPVILSLVYYGCPMLCTLVANGLMDVMRALPFEAGRDYQSVTISFDSTETPDMAAAKKKTYVAELNRPGAEKGWHFLTGDEAVIEQLTKTVGFKYAYDEASEQYAHASGIMIVTPQGRLSHYFYGVMYQPRDVRLALVEASSGKIGSPVDQLLLFCYHYDPIVGKYGPAIMSIIRAGCVATVLSLGVFMGVMFRREARHSGFRPV